LEIKGGLEQQRSEKFYFQRRERKGHMGSCSGTGNRWSPESGWKSGFIAFLLPEGGDFGMDGCQRIGVVLAGIDVSWEEGAFFPLAN
jgi:hypothetical protein